MNLVEYQQRVYRGEITWTQATILTRYKSLVSAAGLHVRYDRLLTSCFPLITPPSSGLADRERRPGTEQTCPSSKMMIPSWGIEDDRLGVDGAAYDRVLSTREPEARPWELQWGLPPA